MDHADDSNLDSDSLTIIHPSAIPPSPIRPSASERLRNGLAGNQKPPMPPEKGLFPLSPTPGGNPLLDAAARLLSLTRLLRQSLHHDNNVNALFENIVREVKQFKEKAVDFGCTHSEVTVASYLLCAFVDESVLATPWGAESSWTKQTLLSRFHQEVRGGEKFFQVLDELLHQPGKHLRLLAFAHVLLSLGFQGRYRLQQDRAALSGIRERLYQVLRQMQTPVEPDLSVNWQPCGQPQTPLAGYLPLWMILAIMITCLSLVYAGLLFSLSRASDPVALTLAATGKEIPMLYAPAPVATPRLAQRLSPRIQAGQLKVIERNHREVIVLQGDAFFAEGKAKLKPSAQALVHEIAAVLQTLGGRVEVSGHTDNIPIRTVKFPSNWELSRARAASVSRILSAYVEPGRIKTEGWAESEPVVDNNTETNRALNRRVEIIWIP